MRATEAATSRSAAETAAALVRSIGLVGLVRPATTPALDTRPSLDTRPVVEAVPDPWPEEPHPEPDRESTRRGTARAHPTVTRLRVASGVASGTNAGNIAGGLGAPDRMLPVVRELRPLLPGGGLRRGSTVATSGATSLVIGLLAAASQSGSWCAVVGMPALGAVAAAEAGVALDRLALVPYPGPDWGTVVGALLDGVDIVVAAPPGPVAAGLTNRLAARARQRGSVLIGYGRWPGADVSIDSADSAWEGLATGRGRLRRRKLTVIAHGRGAAAQRRKATFWMPAYAALDEGWSIGQWRERNHAERALTLVPPIDEVGVVDGPIVDLPAGDGDASEEFDLVSREAVS